MIKNKTVKEKLTSQEKVSGILNSVLSPVLTEMFVYARNTKHLLVYPEAFAHSISSMQEAKRAIPVSHYPSLGAHDHTIQDLTRLNSPITSLQQAKQ